MYLDEIILKNVRDSIWQTPCSFAPYLFVLFSHHNVN